MSECERVVITGLGPVSAVGIGAEDFRAGLVAGRDGRRAPAEAVGELTLAAECLDFAVEDYLESEKTYLDRCSAFVLASCALAFEDAGLEWRELDGPRVGLCVGTAMGCLGSLETVTRRVQARGARMAPPMIFTHAFVNSPASLAAIEYGIKGPAPTFCAGDVSAACGLQYALDLLRCGRADVMLAGGADALSAGLLAALGASGTEWTPGEGACLAVLEQADAARARGREALAELAAVSVARGLERAVEAATAEAGLEETPVRFGAPVGYGHTFGASLALDLAAAVEALRAGEAGSALVAGTDPGGRAAAMVVKRAQ